MLVICVESKLVAAALKYTPIANPAAVASGQPTVNVVVPAQPIAGSSSRPLATSDSSPAAVSAPSLPKKRTAKKGTEPAAKAFDGLHTTMPPPPVLSPAAEDLASKKRRKGAKRPSDTLPSPTPEADSSVHSAQPMPHTVPEKRKAEATPSGAESSLEEPSKKKMKKHVTIEAPSESSTTIKRGAKKKGKSKESADDASTSTLR